MINHNGIQTIIQNALRIIVTAINSQGQEELLPNEDLEIYLRDFRTIYIGLPMRSGKTEFIRQSATAKDLVIGQPAIMDVTETPFMSIKDFQATVKSGSHELLYYETIYVDEAAWSGITAEQVIKVFGRSPEQTFILLGSPK